MLIKMYLLQVLLCSTAFLVLLEPSYVHGEPEVPSKYNKHNDDTQEESLLEWEPPKEFLKNYVYYLSGYDVEGRPVWVSEIGKYDLRKIVEKGGETQRLFDKYIDQILLRYNESVKAANTADKPVKQFTLILDLDGYDMVQFSSVPTIQYVMDLARRFDKSAHETLHRGYLINANFLSESVYNLVKPFLGETLNRMDMYGSNGARWKPVLLRNIPKNQLQAWYGGSASPKDIRKVFG